jgi:hypothetical protein
MKRGDVVLVRFPHPSGQRGKKRPAVVVQSDAYASAVRTVVVAEVTKNLTMKNDPACLFIDVSNTSVGFPTVAPSGNATWSGTKGSDNRSPVLAFQFSPQKSAYRLHYGVIML